MLYIIYANVKSLCCTLGTNKLYVNYISITKIKGKGKEKKRGIHLHPFVWECVLMLNPASLWIQDHGSVLVLFEMLKFFFLWFLFSFQ